MAGIKLILSSDKQHLSVTEEDENHNHPVSKVSRLFKNMFYMYY